MTPMDSGTPAGSWPATIVGSRCSCCGGLDSTTGGCPRCTSRRAYCTCGYLLSCGCGRSFPHRCPMIVIVGRVAE